MTRRGVGGVWPWLESRPVRALWCYLALTVALRIPFLGFPLESDEGGFLMVARQWSGKGVALYTDQWVDRPPLIIVVFKVAAFLGGEAPVLRLLAIGFALVTTTAGWWAGRVINGARGAVASGLVAAVVGSMFAIDGYALTGECIAGALVLSSCALVLEARYRKRKAPAGVWLAGAAGVLAAMAFLTKQNFVDAVVFAAVLLCVRLDRTWRLALGFAAGVAIPVAATVAWALSPNGPGIYRMWVALFRFRQRSLNVIEDATSTAPLERLRWLAVLFIVTGLVLLVIQLVDAVRSARDRRSVRLALLVMLCYDLVSIMVGASWWTHYLLQLTAVLSMAAALVTRQEAPRWRTHSGAVVVTATAVISALVGIHLGLTDQAKGRTTEIVGTYLRDASEPGDSIVLAYGAPNVIEIAGLSTPYRYSWSLPIRTRDPNLKDLVGVLSGPTAPTWLVEIGDFDWWGIDTPAFEQVRADRYRVVATVCGHDIYLRDDLTRALPATPGC